MGALKHSLRLVEAENDKGSAQFDVQFLSFVREKVEIKLPSDLRFLNDVMALLLRHAARFGFLQDDDPQIGIGVGEAVINAIKHGNKNDPAKSVYITAEFSVDETRFTIRDEGEGFDPASVPDPRLDDNRFKPSGRGILLMRHLSDEVVYNEKGNEVTMTIRHEPVS